MKKVLRYLARNTWSKNKTNRKIAVQFTVTQASRSFWIGINQQSKNKVVKVENGKKDYLLNRKR